MENEILMHIFKRLLIIIEIVDVKHINEAHDVINS